MIQAPNMYHTMHQHSNRASYIPFGSFQHPIDIDRDTRSRQEHPPSHVVTPRPLDPSPIQIQLRIAQPLSACPRLPRPNEEMKYFSWDSVRRGGSTVNLSQMTHHDHNPTKAKSQISISNVENVDTNSAAVNKEELNAALTLTSCFKSLPENGRMQKQN
jgi:hypothetical protein